MAGRGPAPKDPNERARTNAPERGEWVDVAPSTSPTLPALPKRGRGEGPWSTRTRRAWTAWRSDWVTAVYGPAEISMAVELAYLYEDTVRDSKPSGWAEVRQWMDRLGLTMKGKRDLRLRPAGTTAAASKAEPPAAKFAELRLVGGDDAVAS